jgi:hypothetical protein
MTLTRNPFADPAASSGVFRPQLKPAPKENCFVCVDPGPGDDYPVPTGTCFIWDTLSIMTGIHRPVKGRYAKLLIPLGAPDPEPPRDGGDPNEWKIITESQVWLGGFDGRPPSLRVLSVTGELALNALSGLYRNLTYKREMQAGMIPVIRICDCAPYENSYGRFGIPVVEPFDFIVRDDDMFDMAIIRPPLPILGGPAAPPKLSNDNGGAAVNPPANDPVAAPAAVPPAAPAASDDPLARYRPAGSGRKPY